MTQSFELIFDRTIPELKTRARLYRHIKTGGQLLSMENDDENKTFGVSFFTPPPSSNGLTHILEHSVLCGSRKYPVKEPFVELLKSSLNTFLNAMTFSDKTIYPVASQNVRDFYNLVDVYLDAVFYPAMTPFTLKQEGWHYELEAAEPEKEMIFKGVVFNEMKGAYSSPDNLLYRWSQQSVLPDTIYGVDSGGDPAEIPNLTWDEFKTYHSTYYHPSNALAYFYGNDDPEERLRIVDEYFKDFAPLGTKISRSVRPQPRFDAPRHKEFGYDAGQGDTARKGFITVNWLLDEIKDPELYFGVSILEHLLLGTPASPLRKALIESGLGEGLAGGGLDDSISSMYMSTGLKGIQPADADKVETLILNTLNDLVKQGIDSEIIEASLNTVEFLLRENNTGGFPRGLLVMIRSLSSWLYDYDPLLLVAYEKPLAAIKARVASGEKYFEGLIQKYLITNQHRSTVLLKPDAEWRKARDAAETDRLHKARAGMSAADVQKVIEDTEELKHRQETPDSEENLAKIPTLKLADLDKTHKPIPIAVSEMAGSKVLYHDLFTNGIVYLDLGLNLHLLPTNLLPYVSLFSRSLLEMGTEHEDYVKLSRRIGRKTGGISSARLNAVSHGSKPGDPATSMLFVRGKATPEHAEELLAILRDILLTLKLDNKERFRQIVLTEKAGLESRLAPGGNAFVAGRVASAFNEADWASEQIGGISYLLFLHDLVETLDAQWEVVQTKLETIRRTLVNRQAMLANVTLDAENWSRFGPQLSSFLSSIPGVTPTIATWAPAYESASEGLTFPAQVNYVAKGANLYAHGYKLHGSSAVVRKLLRTGYLWDKVRVQGGAYGGGLSFSTLSGVFSFSSYRDPNLLRTLDIYDQTAAYLRELDLSPVEVERNIIGAIGDIDAYQLPDAKGYTSMARYLVHEDDAYLQGYRDEVLSTTAQHIRSFGDALEALSKSGRVVVLGSEQAIQGANTERRGKLFEHVIKVM